MIIDTRRLLAALQRREAAYGYPGASESRLETARQFVDYIERLAEKLTFEGHLVKESCHEMLVISD